MYRTFSTFVTVALATLVLQGCMALPFVAVAGANMAAQGAFAKSVNQRQADKCFDIETKAKADGLSDAEMRRNLVAGGCSTAGVK